MPTAGSEAHILSQRVLLADCWPICKKGRRNLGSVLLCRKGRTDVPRLYCQEVSQSHPTVNLC